MKCDHFKFLIVISLCEFCVAKFLLNIEYYIVAENFDTDNFQLLIDLEIRKLALDV